MAGKPAPEARARPLLVQPGETRATLLTLGINAAFHNAAACLVEDGAVIAASEEERFTRVKHGKRPTPFATYELPFHAIDVCLARAGARLAHVQQTPLTPCARAARRALAPAAHHPAE